MQLFPTQVLRSLGPFVICSFLLLLPLTGFAAHFDGENIDGPQYPAFARSLNTGRYYSARVIFDRDRATVQFGTGTALALTLDNENIEDPEEVIGTDRRGSLWALSIDGLGKQGAVALSYPQQPGRCLKGLSYKARLTTPQPGN